ncbi:MAG: metallophosphoesterase [Planctomycetes bacterium]|nr:metallophosphoesterase [Planctomycetota bacterium]
MKRILLGLLVTGLVIGAVAISGGQKQPTKAELQIDVENRNPWTHLRLNNAPENFHFVVVSDRTGGNRGRIFSQAVEQINLLQPTFVVCVGDLIQGYSKDEASLAAQWKEFQTYTSKLQMPFFYVPGNHDVANPTETDVWKGRFGRSYYHFLYKDTLFLAVNSDDPSEEKAKGKISPEQLEYFQKVLKDNASVRWTFVMLHKPLWTQDNLDTNGWLDMEKALHGRKYTVFSGHIHRYQKFVRQGMNYYQLATTGGGSRLRGLRYGEFDHVAWITVKKGADPIIANLMLDGIYPESLKPTITDEPGVPIYNRKPVHVVRGSVMLDGVPAVNVQLIFWRPDASDKEGKKATRVTDAFVEPDGSYQATTYLRDDGLEVGEYKVTATLRIPYFEPSGKLGKNLLPERYATHQTSDLRATVKAGANVIDFQLTSK